MSFDNIWTVMVTDNRQREYLKLDAFLYFHNTLQK